MTATGPRGRDRGGYSSRRRGACYGCSQGTRWSQGGGNRPGPFSPVVWYVIFRWVSVSVFLFGLFLHNCILFQSKCAGPKPIVKEEPREVKQEKETPEKSVGRSEERRGDGARSAGDRTRDREKDKDRDRSGGSVGFDD